MRRISGFYALAAVIVIISMFLTACGENIPTIEINDEGFWVINGENTGISAKGENGKDGLNGIDGKDGADGSNGIDGKDGADGTNGIDGKDGVDGTNGIDGKDGVDGTNGIDGKDGLDGQGSGEFMHISFDDVSACFVGLASGKYTSLFDEPFFAWLLELHNTYGAKFSLYCYTSELSAVPADYANEFFAARDWLKLGLHSDNSSSTFKNHTYEQGKASWNAFVEQVERITGSYRSVDRMPRLHTFGGSLEALRGMRDAKCGALGFLSADDSRLSYYLSQEQAEYLYTHDCLTDTAENLVFLATDLRGDWFTGSFITENQYRTPTEKTVKKELEKRYRDGDFANTAKAQVFFIHEWQIYNGIELNSKADYVTDACAFADEYGLRFSYPQNEISL